MDRDLEKPFQDKLIEFAKRNLLILGLFSIGLILIGIGLIQIFGSRETQIKFEKGENIEGAETASIKVDVAGQVQNPGVYAISADARIQDALIAAGGLSRDADREYIEKAINLAQKIQDGAKIYIPKKGEQVSAGQSSIGGSVGGVSSSGLISINQASSSELDILPGIGPVTAGEIINNRPYGSIDDLLDRKVVGKATFEKIKDLITL